MGCNGPARTTTTSDRGGEIRRLDLNRPDAYGQAFVEVYDQWYGPSEADQSQLEAMARYVAARTAGGVVIELGVGSGRLALPLTEAGLAVIGLDASRSMLDRCPNPVIRVAADMADLPFGRVPTGDVGGSGPTVLCGFNTVFNIGSTERLDRLLASTAGMDGTLITETMNLGLLPEGPVNSIGVAPFVVPGGIVVSGTSTDPDRQELAGRHLEITDNGVASRPWLLRLVGRGELDARAAASGMALIERHRSWEAEPFNDDDATVISVYRRSAGHVPGHLEG